MNELHSKDYLHSSANIWYDIFNCSWVDTRWQ